jgi:hypothetical protein
MPAKKPKSLTQRRAFLRDLEYVRTILVDFEADGVKRNIEPLRDLSHGLLQLVEILKQASLVDTEFLMTLLALTMNEFVSYHALIGRDEAKGARYLSHAKMCLVVLCCTTSPRLEEYLHRHYQCLVNALGMSPDELLQTLLQLQAEEHPRIKKPWHDKMPKTKHPNWN